MRTFALLAAVLAALTLGCAGKDDHDHGSHEQGMDTGKPSADEAKAAGKIEEAFAALSEEDQKLARVQDICPVSDEKLGSMGTPVKVEVKDQTVFLCCNGCKKEILNDPDPYLAKLKK